MMYRIIAIYLTKAVIAIKFNRVYDEDHEVDRVYWANSQLRLMRIYRVAQAELRRAMKEQEIKDGPSNWFGGPEPLPRRKEA